MLDSSEARRLAVPSFSVLRDGSKPGNRALKVLSPPEKRIFFERFVNSLITRDFKPDDLVFSGFDGPLTDEQNESSSSKSHIWVMDTVFWKRTIDWTATANAADYAESYGAPCIGLYDIDQLLVSEEGEQGLQLRELQDLERDEGIFNLVTHIDYPSNLPAAALRGLVFLEYS